MNFNKYTLKAQEAVIDAQRAQVAFYRIMAPFDGVVGDIPVKLGDYVTPQSRLTSLDDNGTLEAYVSVPARNARLAGESTRIELLDPNHETLLVAPVSFVAQAASEDTQAVLLKASFQNDKALREGWLSAGSLRGSLWTRRARSTRTPSARTGNARTTRPIAT